ncbi:outer membrane beta-barrel protein [Neolewinella persica]|uniref:outer membrane beta-barrel protein n=1 Tax=Neolewinella persica TaxID=70998 RepID=UPI000360CA51|nr:outer membrane beta-barrel protein [Neolewinella persica]
MRYFTFALVGVLSLFLSTLTAQTTVGFSVLTGSSSLSSPHDVLPDHLGTHTTVSGTTFGLVLERDLTYNVSLRTGIQQTQRGTTLQQGTVDKVLGASVPLDYEAQIRMNYVEVPLALKLGTRIVQDQVEVYGWGGVTAGYAMTGSIRSRSATSLNFMLMTSKLDMASYAFPRFHLGYSGGVGMGINLGETLQFRLEADYNQSVEKKAMLTPESGKHGYRSLHFGAGMVFRL